MGCGVCRALVGKICALCKNENKFPLSCWRKPYRGRRGRRSSRGRDQLVQLAQGQRRRGACPHPKVFKEPGTRAPWVRPTTPPAAPSGQRAADVGGALRRVLTRRALGHWQTSVRRLPPSRGALATWTGGQRGGTPAPRPDSRPKKGTRYTLKDSICLNPHPETLRDYRSKPTIMPLVNHIRT